MVGREVHFRPIREDRSIKLNRTPDRVVSAEEEGTRSTFLDDIQAHQVGQMPHARHMVAVEYHAVQQRHGVLCLQRAAPVRRLRHIAVLRHATAQALPRLRGTTSRNSIAIQNDNASMVGGRLHLSEVWLRGRYRRQEGPGRDGSSAEVVRHWNRPSNAGRRARCSSPVIPTATLVFGQRQVPFKSPRSALCGSHRPSEHHRRPHPCLLSFPKARSVRTRPFL